MYQGHKNWNHWNVSLWLMNEEPLYRLCQHACRVKRTKDDAARYLLDMLPPNTPDGAPYTFTSVRAAIAHWGS